MKRVSLFGLACASLVMAGPASAELVAGMEQCVATADLPKNILGTGDTIRITQQAAELNGAPIDPEIRVMDPAGNTLGSFTFTFAKANASVTYRISEIYDLARLKPFRDGLSPNVVQIVGFRDFQAVYRNGLGFVTPLVFTCEAYQPPG